MSMLKVDNFYQFFIYLIYLYYLIIVRSWYKYENKNKKVRCPKCNKFISSMHGRNKPIRSKYLKSCEQRIILIINKKSYHCYNYENIFTEDLKYQYKTLNSYLKMEN